MRGDSPRLRSHDAAARGLLEGGLAGGVARFGWPLAVAMGLYAAFSLVDLLMISRLPNGTAALAALAICDLLNAVVAILSNGVSTASVAVISRRVGQGDPRGAADAVVQSLWLVAGLSILFGVLGVAGADVLVHQLMRAKGEAAALAVPYLQILIGGSASIFLLLQVTAILRALGMARWSALLLVAGNLLNVVLDALLIYGAGPHPHALAWLAPVATALEVPRLEVVGAAWATLAGRSLPALLGLLLVWRACARPRARVWPVREQLRRLVEVAWPASAQQVLHVTAVLAFVAIINARFTTPQDATAATAYSIALRLEMFVLFVSVGWGSAASTYVGANLGAGGRARAWRAGWVAAGYGLLTAVALLACYLIFAEPLVAFFDPSTRVVATAVQYLVIVGGSYLVLAAGTVLSQAMTGAGATRSSMVIDGLAFWGLAVPVALVGAVWLERGLPAVFWSIALGNTAAGLGFAYWYSRGRFMDREL